MRELSVMVAIFFYIMFYLYLLYSAKAKKFYIGYSSDPYKRLQQHLNNKGDKYTGKYNDWKLQAVFKISESRAEALRIEKFIKRQKSRKLLELLCEPDFVPVGKLAQLVRVPQVRD